MTILSVGKDYAARSLVLVIRHHRLPSSKGRDYRRTLYEMADPAAKTSLETSGSPAEFLKNVVGKQVRVRIGSGIDYEGEPR